MNALYIVCGLFWAILSIIILVTAFGWWGLLIFVLSVSVLVIAMQAKKDDTKNKLTRLNEQFEDFKKAVFFSDDETDVMAQCAEMFEILKNNRTEKNKTEIDEMYFKVENIYSDKINELKTTQ